MGLFEHFPYSNFHDLNLNWIISKVKNIEQITADVAEQSAAAVQSAADAAESAESAAGSAEAAAGSAQEAADTVEPFTSTVTEIRARMNAFVQQHSGPAAETVLFTSDTPVYSGTITPTSPLANYRNVKFVWRHRNDICEQEFKLTGESGQNFYLRDCLGAYGAGNSATWEMCQLLAVLSSDGDINITSATVIDNSQYNDGPVDGDMNTGIMQVIGVRNVADTEVVDARVGADNTTYSTLKERLNAEYDHLQNMIGDSGGMTPEFKAALENILAYVVYRGDDPTGRTYLNDLHDAMYPPAVLTRITAAYTQTHEVYETDSLDTLRDDLVVTAYYDNGVAEIVSNYTLSGELTLGSSTITAAYGGKTANFTVLVSAYSPWRNNVLTLTSDDLLRARVDNVSPYYVAATNRVSYVGMDIDVSTDYTYTFEYETTMTGNTNIGIQYLTQAGVDLVEQQGTFNQSDTRKVDLGWQSNGYVLTPAETAKVIWLVFRAGTGTTSIWPENFPTVTITRTAVQ